MQVFGQSADRQKTQKAVYCLCFRKAKGRKASDSLQVFLFKEGAYRIPFVVFILYQVIDNRGGRARPSVLSTSSLLLWDSMQSPVTWASLIFDYYLPSSGTPPRSSCSRQLCICLTLQVDAPFSLQPLPRQPLTSLQAWPCPSFMIHSMPTGRKHR